MKQPPLPDSIGNRYKVDSSIGEGGMGTVYKAHDPMLNITVAIKQMHQAESPEAMIRFQNEAVALAKLNHPNIAKVLDFAYDDGVTYMVMEYLDGASYASLLKTGKLSLLENVSIFLGIAHGLVHAHKKGVLHRDLKPSNVMIVNDTTGDVQTSIAKIVDFGIAKLHGDQQRLTTTNSFVGSPLYMSPEQAQGHTVDSRSEVYSFGCLMFEALKGHVPLKGKTALETINMHIDTPAPRLNSSSKDPQFPEELDNLIFRCLKKIPDERVQSATQLVTELQEIHEDLTAAELERQEALERELVEGGDKHGSTDPGVTELQLSILSNKLLIGGTVGFLLMIIAISFYLYQSATKEPPKTAITKVEQDLASAIMKEPNEKIESAFLAGTSKYDSGTQSLEVRNVGSEVEMHDVKDLRLPIKNLKLVNCDVQGKFFELVNRDALRTLALESTQIDDDGTKLFPTFKNLIGFQSTKNINLTSKTYSQLASFPKLAFLYIDPADHLTDEVIHNRVNWQELAIFIVGTGPQLTDKSVDDLNKFTKIFNIGLKRCGFTANGLARLIMGHKLSILDLEELPFNDKTCNSIVKQPKLNRLVLKRIKGPKGLTSQNFRDICNVKTIIELEIDCRNVDKEALCSIKNLTDLKKLSLFNAKWSDKLLNTLLASNLESLKVDESDMPLEHVRKFAEMKRLKLLELIHFDEQYQNALTALGDSTEGRIKWNYEIPRPSADAANFLGDH